MTAPLRAKKTVVATNSSGRLSPRQERRFRREALRNPTGKPLGVFLSRYFPAGSLVVIEGRFEFVLALDTFLCPVHSHVNGTQRLARAFDKAAIFDDVKEVWERH